MEDPTLLTSIRHPSGVIYHNLINFRVEQIQNKKRIQYHQKVKD
jgi:hypothetical protein